MVLTSHLIVGLLYITSPSFAQATTVIPPNEAHASKDGVVTVGDYLPMPEKPVEDTSFKLLSVGTNQNPTMEWPKVVSCDVTVMAIPFVCTVITITICLIVLGIIIYYVIKVLRCLDRLLNPPTNTNDADATISALYKSSASGFETPLAVWDLPTAVPLQSSTNLQDWIPYLVLSNKFLQMPNTDCYLLSTVYRGGIQLTSILSRVFVTMEEDKDTFDPYWNAPATLMLTNMNFSPVIGTNLYQFFRSCGSNYLEQLPEFK